MKELIWQKYSWLRQMSFFFVNIIRCLLNSTFYLLTNNPQLSYWWFNEIKETFIWIKIHLTHKSKRVK